MKMFRELVFSLVEGMIGSLPGTLGRRLRYTYYKRRLKLLGKSVVFDVGVRIHSPESVSIGDNTWIDNYVVILAGPPTIKDRAIQRKPNPFYHYSEGEVVIGRNCHIANFVVIQGHGGLSIGDDSGVASGSLLYSMSHHYRNPGDCNHEILYKFSPMVPGFEQTLIISPVVMEKNTALGLNSIILPGSTIREGSWVASNSTVVKTIPAHSIASGNPARIISQRS